MMVPPAPGSFCKVNPMRPPRPARPVPKSLPSLPIVTAVAGALISASCDAPARQQNAETRVCQTADGVRAPDANCERRMAGHGFIFIPGAVGAIGDRINAPRSNPADVSRGGLGMSAHSSVSE